jgi:short-subunit dehydrogenase
MKPVVLITGASSGMGKASAMTLLQEGCRVYGAARRVDKMQYLTEAGGEALAMDITKDADIQKCVNTIIQKEGRIDALVNNAGFGLFGAVEDTTLEDARYQFEVNLFGLARITQLVLPHMRAKQSGRIINISSMGGKMYTPLGAWYHATKHALEGWSDCLRLELKEFNISVSIIEPGIINTNFGSIVSDTLLKRSGKGAYHVFAQHVANATEKLYASGNGSPPSVVAQAVLRAIKSKRPRTRYVVGKWSRILITVRIFCGDRIFDALALREIRSASS